MAISAENRLKQRAVIEFLSADGCMPIDMQRNITLVYGDTCVDVSIVRSWARSYKATILEHAMSTDHMMGC